MAIIKNFIDEKNSRKIIDAICALDYNAVHKLSKDSGIPVYRLQGFVDGDEKITLFDKGRLITHLINLVNFTDEEDRHKEAGNEVVFVNLRDFQRRKAG